MAGTSITGKYEYPGGREYLIGVSYNKGENYLNVFKDNYTPKINKRKALKYFLISEKKGFVDSQYEIADAYSHGLGIKPNWILSIHWYKVFIGNKNIDIVLKANALYHLAKLYLSDKLPCHDYNQGMTYLQKAIDIIHKREYLLERKTLGLELAIMALKDIHSQPADLEEE